MVSEIEDSARKWVNTYFSQSSQFTKKYRAVTDIGVIGEVRQTGNATVSNQFCELAFKRRSQLSNQLSISD